MYFTVTVKYSSLRLGVVVWTLNACRQISVRYGPVWSRQWEPISNMNIQNNQTTVSQIIFYWEPEKNLTGKNYVNMPLTWKVRARSAANKMAHAVKGKQKRAGELVQPLLAGELVQPLRVLSSCRDLGCVPHTHMAACSSVTPVSGDRMPFSGLCGH